VAPQGQSRIEAAPDRAENDAVSPSAQPEVAMIRKPLLFAFALCLALAPLAADADDSSREFSMDARVTLDAFRATVDARLEGILAVTRTLAATEEARSGDWTRIRGPLAILATHASEQAAVWYARPDGSYSTVEKGPTGESLRERSYFPELLAGREVVGALVISKSTGKRSVIVASPVLVDGKVSGAIGVSLDATKLSASLDQSIRFPPDVVFYALDREGRTALHRAGELIFVFPSDVGSPTLGDAVRTMLAQPEGVVHYAYGGSDKSAAFGRSALTGWTLVLGKSHPARVTP
jgi:methyl-accepting chemotaxis protein